MLTPVFLLPLAAVLINDVKAQNSNGEVTVEIATSDPVATSDIRVVSGGPRRLYVYLNGSAARRSSFGEAPTMIVAHPRLRYTKLEIPTTDRCGAPIGVVGTDTGVRVRATCRDATTATTVVPPVRVDRVFNAERPLPDAPQAAQVRDKTGRVSLRAALALPPEVVAEDSAADVAAGEGSAKAAVAEKPQEKAIRAADPSGNPHERSDVAAKAKTAGVAPEQPKVDTPDAPTAAIANQEVSRDVSKNPGTDQKSGSGAATMVVAVVLLLGVGIVATLFARRRISRERVIRIVETASIGPRRSLVVACVGGRTMVLGVSEAGVALLDSQVPALAVAGLRENGPSAAVEDAAHGLRNLSLAGNGTAEEVLSEAKHESSLLGRLFHRKPRDSEGLAPEDFEHLFSESLEDEDLRRKLAMGESGRVA